VRNGSGSNRARTTLEGIFSRLRPAFGNNDRIIDQSSSITLQKLLLVPGLIALALSACEPRAEPPSAAETPAGAAESHSAPFHSDARADKCVAGTFLKARVLGVVRGQLDADAAELRCDGGPRPDGQGARLYFALEDGDSSGFAIIVALPALQPGTDGSELAANVTVILEGEARFFSTQDRDICWADVTSEARPDGSANNRRSYLLGGRLYCIAPLAEVGGIDSIMIEDAQFRGLLDWGAG